MGNRERRFLELKNPKLFIASPQTSLIEEVSGYRNKQNRLLNDLIKDLKLAIPQIDCSQIEKTIESKEDFDSFNNIFELRRNDTLF